MSSPAINGIALPRDAVNNILSFLEKKETLYLSKEELSNTLIRIIDCRASNPTSFVMKRRGDLTDEQNIELSRKAIRIDTALERVDIVVQDELLDEHGKPSSLEALNLIGEKVEEALKKSLLRRHSPGGSFPRLYLAGKTPSP